MTKGSEVKCLGKTFASEEERREYFRDELRKMLPELKKIEGFPIGEDEDIIALSDPPYYTACPNPWLNDFIAEWESEKADTAGRKADFQVDEPYASDVSEGKNNPIYNAHSYHTKVPHPAIMRYILHYTQPGDIIFDGFAGTGMTGVAAQMCGRPDPHLQFRIETEFKSLGLAKPVWGARKAICGDLSPIASFIAYNYNTPVAVYEFEKEAKRILHEVEEECGWMYETLHSGAGILPAKKAMENAGWSPALQEFKQTKRDLPHWQFPGAILFVTFNTYQRVELPPQARDIVLNAIKYWHGSKIHLFSAVVMPDHVHMLFQLLKDNNGHSEELSKVMHSIKSFSANEVNKIENRSGILWQNESYDHIIRDEADFNNTLNYIYYNPIKKDITNVENVKQASSLYKDISTAGRMPAPQPYKWYFRNDSLDTAGWKPAPLGRINYTVWSDVFICPACGGEIIFWEAAVDKEAGKVKDEFHCTHCNAIQTKRSVTKAKRTVYDKYVEQEVEQASCLQENVEQASSLQKAGSSYAGRMPAPQSIITQTKTVPVLINYTYNGKRHEKAPDEYDLDLIKKIEETEIPYWFPTDRMPEGDESRRNDREGITHVHHFHIKSCLAGLACYWQKAAQIKNNRLGNALFLAASAANPNFSKMRRFRSDKKGGGPLAGTLYISSIITPQNPITSIKRNMEFVEEAFLSAGINALNVLNQAAPATNQVIFDNSIDYIFTDPPFGANIMYSELNFLWESWLKVKTNNKSEAVENKTQGKSLLDYQDIMTQCFREYFRILKPGRWMTVEFSNTSAAVWNGIQTALQMAGFIVANVAALDKQQGSFKAVTTTTAVKQDLVISCYKPSVDIVELEVEQASSLQEADAGKMPALLAFLEEHLRHLPVHVAREQKTTAIIERSPRILYDRLISLYIMRGLRVPIDAADFQDMLMRSFIERDGMYFLPEQVAEYDKKKALMPQMEQMALIVTTEAEGLLWLKAKLTDKMMTYQTIQPEWMQAITAVRKGEILPELKVLLEENFIQEPDGRWRLPDMNEAKDREALRTKSLLKEFDKYVEQASCLRVEQASSLQGANAGRMPAPLASSLHKGMKKLKEVRIEALHAGFKSCWEKKDFQTIITIGDKIPQNLLLEDEQLLMFYDIAKDRV